MVKSHTRVSRCANNKRHWKRCWAYETFAFMNAVQVDQSRRLTLPMLKPGDFYETEMRGENEILLRKVVPRPQKMTKEEILQAIEQSPIRFTASWDEIKE